MRSLAERLRVRSENGPLYNVDGSDDEDEVLTYQRRRRRTKDGKKQDDTMRDDSSLTKRSRVKEEEHLEKMTRDDSELYTRSERNPPDTAKESDDEDDVPIGRRRRMAKQESEKIMRDDPSLTTCSVGERLRVRPEKRPSYNVDESDGEDETFVVQRRSAQVEKNPKKIMQDDRTSTASSLVERLRVRSGKRPSYNVDESDDEDEVPLAQRRGRQKEEKPPEKILLKYVNLSTGSMVERLHTKSEERSSYNDTDKSDDEDEVPIGHIRGMMKGDKPLEKITRNDPSKASSLGERHCVRTTKRPLYKEDDSDDDDEFSDGPRRGRPKKEKSPEKIIRDDTKEDACQACGESGSLIGCGTCTYVFHRTCVLLPRRATFEDGWSCPECVNPLNETEKILDIEMRPVSGKTDASKQDQKQNCVRQYLVKWKGLSYLHCTWVAEDEFRKAFKTYPRLKSKLNNFKAKMESANISEDDFIAVRPEWTTVDRVIASRKNGDESEYFVKWKELGYDECSWEVESDISAFQSQIEKFHMIQSRGCKKSSCKNKSFKQGAEDSKDKQKEFHHYEQTPEFLSGTLHPYQLEGLNFLRYSWSKKTHVILADEMGLGKTIQSIAFLSSLLKENLYPHLVVAPLSTLRNWEREFSTWAPEMNVVMYFGSGSARAIARQYEFFYPKEEAKKQKRKKSSLNVHKSKQRRIKFDVLLTSYEMINLDSTSLKNIQWECLIVDEGHRLKNKDSKLFLQLKLYATKQRVLLTGTPLQNNLDELFMLMHFLDNGKFRSIEEFQKEFTDINQEEQIERLHKMLAPHLLRRVKKDVLKDLPPKKELILRVELSNKQKEYYKAILTRNYQVLARRSGAQISLNNVVMELRKLCGHAYMLEGVEPVQQPSDANEGLRQLLESSGKVQLLDKMMVKLKEKGHRVLIYSQFQHMLDLLEDYLSYKKWSYERIDGKVSGAERQIRIDRFNANNSTRFCFLLSTRAGGLGINLASADTVIIFDSDWNPHADLQAMARAHRLGQINKVMIYRLITRGTIEERMMQLTKKKMILEHLVVGRLKAQKTVNQEELDDIIRYGSKELFADENDEAGKARQIHYDDAAIERLLNRDQIVGEESSIGDEDDDFLKAFKVANFEYIDEVEAAAAAAAAAAEELAKKQVMTDKAFCADSDRANYWDDLLRDKYEVHQVEALNALGKGKRSRKQLAASVDNDPCGAQDGSSEDEYCSYEDYLSESETTSSGISSGNRVQKKKARAGHLESLPLMEGEGKSLRILGFNQYQRNVFLQTLMRFGFGDYDWKEFVLRLNGKTFEEIHEYGFLFMRHIDEGINDSQAFSDGVPKEGLRVEDVFVRLAQIRLIKEKMKFLNENPGASLFPEDIKECYPSLIGKFWRERNDIMLLKAVLKHGYGRWQPIVDDKELGLVDVVCRELSLPSLSEILAGGVQMNDAPSSNHSVNGFSETGKGSQSHTNCSTPYQYREVERRIVDFIRKRYQLLEKLLDLELCLDEDEKANACDAPNQDPNIEQTKTGISSSVPLDTNPLLRELPDLEAIAAPSEELPFDYQVERLSMAQLYNGICEVVETDSLVAIEACLGDSRANYRFKKNMDRLEPFCEDVLVILARGSETLNSEVVKENHVDLKASSGSPAEANGHISDSSVLNGQAKDAKVVEESTDKAADLDE